MKVPGPEAEGPAGRLHFSIMRDGRGVGGRKGTHCPKAQGREPMRKANLFAPSPNVVVQDVAVFSGLILFPIVLTSFMLSHMK